MPDIRKLKDAVEECVDLEWMPMVEELLVRGTKAQREEYAAELTEWAEDREILAFTMAGGYRDGFALGDDDDLDDPELWELLESEGKLTEVLHYWNLAMTYRYWSRVLRACPVRRLFKFGRSDCEFSSTKTRRQCR